MRVDADKEQDLSTLTPCYCNVDKDEERDYPLRILLNSEIE